MNIPITQTENTIFHNQLIFIKK